MVNTKEEKEQKYNDIKQQANKELIDKQKFAITTINPALQNTQIKVFTGKRLKDQDSSNFIRWYGNDNYRIVPHNLFKAIIKANMEKLDYKIVLYLYDLSFGWDSNHTEKAISLTTIKKFIGSDEKAIKKALIRLEKNWVIFKHFNDVSKHNTILWSYYFNKFFELWKYDNQLFKDFVEKEKVIQMDRLKKLYSVNKKNGKIPKFFKRESLIQAETYDVNETTIDKWDPDKLRSILKKGKTPILDKT